jgi:lipoate-protein ligase A
MRRVRLLNLGMIDWNLTQSVYHALAESMGPESPDTLILCRPAQPYVCLGYHQEYDATLDRQACRRLGLPVYRRRLGGGATYLDSNQLFYQCVMHHSRAPAMFQHFYQQTLTAPVRVLQRLGLEAILRDINEIEIQGRRIAGTGGGRIGEACVVVGNILFDFDFDALCQIWRVPWGSFRDLAAEALPRCITSLRGLGSEPPFEGVEAAMLEEFEQALRCSLEPDSLTHDELTRAAAASRRNTSEDGQAAHDEAGTAAPMHALKIAAGVWVRASRFRRKGLDVCASVLVRDETVEACRIHSSPVRVWDDLERRAQGIHFSLWQQQMQGLMA